MDYLWYNNASNIINSGWYYIQIFDIKCLWCINTNYSFTAPLY